MNIKIEKLTDYSLLQRAAEATSGAKISAPLGRWYDSEHSPIRVLLFWIEMEGIPSFVSTHLVRHNVGITHFVRSNREDRGGVKNANRLTPVNHSMLINAQALLHMARKRLCGKASKETREVMNQIKWVMREVDKDLADRLVPECRHLGRCREFGSCGYFKGGER